MFEARAQALSLEGSLKTAILATHFGFFSRKGGQGLLAHSLGFALSLQDAEADMRTEMFNTVLPAKALVTTDKHERLKWMLRLQM